VVAEFANARQRNLCVALMAGGFPVGAVIGGTLASSLLTAGDWRVVFEIGAIATGLCLPPTWFLLPESVAYLVQRRPAGALARINQTLRKMGHSEVDGLPAVTLEAPRPTLRELFAPGLARTTILLTVAYFAHIMTFYFILKWIPKIVVDMGYEPSTAGGVLVWANVGGAAGALLISLSFLSQRVGVRPAVIGALVLSSIMVILFGQGQSDLTQLALVAAATGLCTNAAVVGLYAIFAQSFPTAVRATGTGLVIGVGRGGAALGPIIAGVLFQAGSSLASVAWVMASGSLLGGLALLALRAKNGVRNGECKT
jgi:MFS family permease